MVKAAKSAKAVRTYWDFTRCERDRFLRFGCLDSMISEDDPVRLVDEVLNGMDWEPWEAKYHPTRGRPPIHPRVLASVMIYGLYRGIRSSRKLEEACTYRFDFMWLAQGHQPDHSTLSEFRTRFGDPLKSLFKQIGHVAMIMGLIRLGDVAFDGTRVKANNSRYRTGTAVKLEQKLQVLDQLYEQAIADTAANDEAAAHLGSPTHLPQSVASLEARREKISAALKQAREADQARRHHGVDPAKNPAQVPLTDPESRVMPNKEGGYAPNYTPTQITDGHRGFILDADVVADVNESGVMVESVDRIEETFGERPQRVLTDSGNSSGPIMQAMEEREIELFVPAKSQQPQPGDAAHRDDPRQSVPESSWPQLPRNTHGQLDKSCFVYDPQQDQFYCPRGEALCYEQTKREQRRKHRVERRVYRCQACAGCPLAAACLTGRGKRGRTIACDQYEQVRERTAARMSTAAAKTVYNQRPRIVETTFGIIKGVMGVRQFLTRGLAKVKTEWQWAATAFNLMKLVREVGRLRAKFARLAAAAAI